ncbi:hypothetical protein [Streptomyces sp. NPDC059928]|uniref:hypothetical protein n=1 Tax=unclassified Streptomyces TaxID=2593676 RepID=UPI0036686ABF
MTPRDVGEGRHAEVDGGGAVGDEVVELGEFGVGRGEADLEPFGLAGPALSLGLGDPVDAVVADVHQAGPLGRGGPQERAADATVLMNATGAVGPAAVTEGDLSALEVAEELLPLLLGGAAVLLAGPQVPAAGDERPVSVDDFLGIDR